MNVIADKVTPTGYCADGKIYINRITFEFTNNTKTILTANTDIPELLTVFCDIDREHGKNSNIFDIGRTLCDKMIHSITIDDTPTFNDTMNGYYTFYNKITIVYGESRDNNKKYEFFVLQSSNGFTSGYCLIE
jgi:hypothetical protein